MKTDMMLLIAAIIAIIIGSAQGSELNYQFKNPSFSGIGAGAQWLTIENQEFSRRKAIQDKIEADLKAKATEEKNSILNRFLNNLQSRVYSQLAQQLTTNLFVNQSDSGSFTLEGNTINYSKTVDGISVAITDDAGNVTEIVIPLSGFKF